jgi:predicted DNA-binding antitoxin AbrB/MazE fold protein
VREVTMEIVTVVYEKGVLRPLQPLNLRERQTVRIQVLQEELAEAENEYEAAIRVLVAEGLLTPPPGRSDVPPISEQERLEFADRLGSAPGKPLSEIIIEDRGEW